MLFTITLLACIGSMIFLFRRCCLYSGRIHINPVFGLLMGLSFYVLLPSSSVYYFADLIEESTAYGRELSQGNAELVMLFTVALLLALNVGAGIWQATQPRQLRLAWQEADSADVFRTRWKQGASWPAILTMVLSLLLFTALAFTVRDSLFSGYDPDVLGDDSVWAARGAMSSAYSLFYVSMCVYILRRRNGMSRAARWALMLSFGFISLILLSMGARLYVAMALLSLLALKSAISNGIPARNVAVFLLGGALLMGSVGVLRTGSLQGIESVARNILLEPLLTSISLYTLLDNNTPIWVGQVHMIFADFQAVLPSVMFPDKAGLFERLNTYGFSFEAPVGGYHLYFSGLINFGYLGMGLVALWAGYALARISRRPLAGPIRASTLIIGTYLTGALTFTVFRDPFFIAIAKNVLVVGLVLPIILTSFNNRVAKRLRVSPVVAHS